MKAGWLTGVAVLLALAGCGNDSGGASTTGSTEASLAAVTTLSTQTSTTIAIQTPATVGAPSSTSAAASILERYTVQQGDALFLIAHKHCTTADALVAANAWADGLNHPLYPGDVISLPSEACAAADAPTTTAELEGTEVTSDPDSIGFGLVQVINAFNIDGGFYAGEFTDSTCTQAYAANLAFEGGAGSREDAVAGLQALAEALQFDIPPETLVFIDLFDSFVQNYRSDVIRITDLYYRAGDAAALADSALEEVWQAFKEVRAHGPRGRFFIDEVCAAFQVNDD